MNARYAAPLVALLVGFGVGWALHAPRPRHAAQNGAETITVNYPNPNPAEPGKPRLTCTLHVCRVTDPAGERDVGNPDDFGAQWVVKMGETTYRAGQEKP